MKHLAWLLLCMVDVFPRCGKPPRPPAAETPIVHGTAQSPRRIEINVSNQGYTPGEVRGFAGEAVTLVFRYDPSAGECGREVVLPAQNVRVTLTEKAPAEIALTLPTTPGSVEYACGMNMLHGRIQVE